MALRRFPIINASLRDEKIYHFKRIHINVALDTERGLLVPLLRDPDRKNLTSINTEIAEITRRGREGLLKPEDLQDGTFTVTNLGMYDVKLFLPIINPPEAAILAAGGIEEKPVVVDQQIVTRPMMTLTLAYDHRVIDGAPAAKFLGEIKELIETGLPKEPPNKRG